MASATETQLKLGIRAVLVSLGVLALGIVLQVLTRRSHGPGLAALALLISLSGILGLFGSLIYLVGAKGRARAAREHERKQIEPTTVELPYFVSRAIAKRVVPAHSRMLEAVGYWRPLPVYRHSANPETLRLPDPTLLVCPDWCQEERRKIVSYLKSGLTFIQWCGFSYCRFECDLTPASPRVPGTRCLTDGQWVWPEGLVHYIEQHDVMLPEEFIETMKRNSWRVDPLAGKGGWFSPDGVGPHPGDRVNSSFWINWGEANSGKRA